MIASSLNFSLAEVQRASRSVAAGDLARLQPAMQHTLGVLEKVRRRLGVPVTIVSFVRSPEHNASVGGSETSDHLTGYAADVRAGGAVSNAQAYELLRPHLAELGIDQLIYDPTDQSLHIGTGPRQRHRAWVEASSPADALSRLFDSELSNAQRLAAMGFTGIALLLAAAMVFSSERGQ